MEKTFYTNTDFGVPKFEVAVNGYQGEELSSSPEASLKVTIEGPKGSILMDLDLFNEIYGWVLESSKAEKEQMKTDQLNTRQLAKVTRVSSDQIRFDNGWCIESSHTQDCCESHYLAFVEADCPLGAEFDLTGNFFEAVDGYGIRLLPVGGLPIPVPGYGSNNGYYSTELTLCVIADGKVIKTFDISECQEISE